MRISCSNCGKPKLSVFSALMPAEKAAPFKFRYSQAAARKRINEGWNSCGNALCTAFFCACCRAKKPLPYCPICSTSWRERNGSRPMGGAENTFAVINDWRERRK